MIVNILWFGSFLLNIDVRIDKQWVVVFVFDS